MAGPRARLRRTAGAATVLLRVFLTQAVVAWVISFPLHVAAAYDVRWWPVVWIGVVVFAIGVFFEVVGDVPSAVEIDRVRVAYRDGLQWATQDIGALALVGILAR